MFGKKKKSTAEKPQVPVTVDKAFILTQHGPLPLPPEFPQLDAKVPEQA